MENFMKYDFDISKITIAKQTKTNQGSVFHKNRVTHGLIFNPGCDKTYKFENGKTITVFKNEIIYLPRSSSYAVITPESVVSYLINFELFSGVNFAPFSFKPKNTSGYIKLFRKAEALWRRMKPTYHMQCKAVLYEILSMLQSEYQMTYTNKNTGEILAPAVQYIHEKYVCEKISVQTLAKMCDVGEAYFRRLFHQVYGISPIKYINNLKMEYAGDLIDSRLYTISEVAEQTGFSDICYFSRKFKQSHGFSPTDYISRTDENISIQQN